MLRYGRAARRLGLPAEVAKDIVDAVDDPTTARTWLRARVWRAILAGRENP